MCYNACLLVLPNRFCLVFPWCSGYHIRLTRGRSPVRSRAETHLLELVLWVINSTPISLQQPWRCYDLVGWNAFCTTYSEAPLGELSSECRMILIAMRFTRNCNCQSIEYWYQVWLFTWTKSCLWLCHHVPVRGLGRFQEGKGKGTGYLPVGCKNLGTGIVWRHQAQPLYRYIPTCWCTHDNWHQMFYSKIENMKEGQILVKANSTYIL